MLSILNGLRGIDFWGVLIRVLLSCLCGALVGLERSAKNRPAGFRTHILVCLGSAVAAVTGIYLYVGMNLPADVSRISAQVISGLGFIGAGTIIVTKKMTIKGLTTAAGLWTTGIVGLAIGSGYYEGGIVGTLLILLTETYLGRLSDKIQKNPEYSIELHYSDKNALDHVLRFCKDSKMSITSLHIHTLNEEESPRYAARVSLRGSMREDALLAQIEKMPGIGFVTGL